MRDLHGAHGADVETKETASNDGDGRDEVDVTELLHHGGQCMFTVLMGPSLGLKGDSRSLCSEEGCCLGCCLCEVVEGVVGLRSRRKRRWWREAGRCFMFVKHSVHWLVVVEEEAVTRGAACRSLSGSHSLS